MQHLVNTPAYIIAGLVALLVTAGIVTVIVRRRRPGPGTSWPTAGPGPAGGQFADEGERSVSAGEQRRRA